MIHHKNQHLVSKGFWGEKVSILQPTFLTTKFYSTVMFTGLDLAKSPEVWTNSALSFCFFTSGSADVSTSVERVEDGTWKWWFLKNGYIQGSIWNYICHILHRYITYIFLFMGSIFRFHVTFFWRVGCVGGYICFTRRYGMPKDPKFLPRNGIICACDTLRILRHLLRMVYQAFGSRSDTPCFTFSKQKVILRDFYFTTIPSLSNMKEEWYYWLLMQGTRQAFKNQSETTFDTTNPDSCIIIL